MRAFGTILPDPDPGRWPVRAPATCRGGCRAVPGFSLPITGDLQRELGAPLRQLDVCAHLRVRVWATVTLDGDSLRVADADETRPELHEIEREELAAFGQRL